MSRMLYTTTVLKILCVSLLLVHKSTSLVIPCPSHCKCDVYKNHRRATCRNQSLISVEADVPRQVQLLDLSHNLIHELSDHIFMDLQLTSVKYLNLSHNKISQIHMNAFSEMSAIKVLDLSFNNIEYLLDNWFWNVIALQELYLGHNHLGRLQDGPILESKSLKLLDLSSCFIPHLPEDAFSKLPNLESLDLSGNLIIQLNINVIKPLHNLRKLHLGDNPWQCSLLTNLTSYCKSKGISCSKLCQKTPKVEKFQKMVVEEKSIEETSWIYEDLQQGDNVSYVNVCLNNTDFEEKSILLKMILINPVLAILSSLICGFILGIFVVCGMFVRRNKPKQQICKKQRFDRIRKKDVYSTPLIQPGSFEVGHSTPVLSKKRFIKE